MISTGADFLNDTIPLGVIAPPAVMAIQLVIPLLVALSVALFYSFPQMVLYLFHWSWVHGVSKTLKPKPHPEVRGAAFEGIARSSFADRYSFSLTDAGGSVAHEVVRFFEGHGAKVESDAKDLSFSRGRSLYAYLAHLVPIPETMIPQDIRVEFSRTSDCRTDVCVRYCVYPVFMMLRVRPSGLRKEVQELYARLQASLAA